MGILSCHGCRPDLNGLAETFWALFIIFVPLFGALAHVIARPSVVIAQLGPNDRTWGKSPSSTPTSGGRAGSEYLNTRNPGSKRRIVRHHYTECDQQFRNRELLSRVSAERDLGWGKVAT